MNTNTIETEICEICLKNSYFICSFCHNDKTFYSVYNYYDGKKKNSCFECSKKLHSFKFNDKIIKFHEDEYDILKKIFNLD